MAPDSGGQGWARRNALILGIATTVVVGIGCLPLGAYLQRRASRALLYWDVQQSTLVRRASDQRLRISYDGHPVDRVTVAYLRVTNVGSVPVVWGSQVDAEDGIWVSPPVGAKLLAVDIQSMSAPGIHAEVVPGDEKVSSRWVTNIGTFSQGVVHSEEGDVSNVRFRSMNSGEAFWIRVTHTGDEGEKPRLDGRMVGGDLLPGDPAAAAAARRRILWAFVFGLFGALAALGAKVLQEAVSMLLSGRAPRRRSESTGPGGGKAPG